MIWPNLRIGAPVSIGAVAILWPLGTRADAAGPPDGRVADANLVDGDHHIVLGVEA